MMYRMLSLAALALALAMFLVAPALADKEADAVTHDGKVVSVTADKLIMTGKNGNEHTHTIAADAKLSCDGKVCQREDLKPGMKIRVTTKQADKEVATRIEALDKRAEFEKSN